jgi:hypothetical protein
MIFMCCLLGGTVIIVALLYGVAKLQRRSQIVSAPAFRNAPFYSEELFLGAKETWVNLYPLIQYCIYCTVVNKIFKKSPKVLLKHISYAIACRSAYTLLICNRILKKNWRKLVIFIMVGCASS